MSSILTSQGMVLATAMAVSGTMILLAALKLQKSADQFSFNPILHHPRSCISTDGKKKEKKKKRVKFAEDVVEPSGNSEEYRKLHCNNNFSHGNGHEAAAAAAASSSNSDSNAFKKSGKVQEMPANRVALYNSMLKGRVINRVTYSY